MKRLLIFLICSVLVFSSLSFTAGAAETDISETAADTELADEAQAVSDDEPASVGATADEAAPTGYWLLTEEEFQSKMSAMRVKYPHGSIWEGVYYESGSAKAWTCWAYSAQMLREFFGVNFYADGMLSNKYYDTSGICAGDWVRIDWDSHSIFITKVTASGVYYTDGNGTGVYNQVRWDGFYSWSEINGRFSYRLHVPGNNLKGNADEIKHTVAYAGNGGSGSMASQTVSPNTSFTLKNNGFTRSGYSFSGYIVRRSYDNTYYTTDAGWKTQDEIYNNGYHYKIYPQGNTYNLGTPWLGNITSPTAFTFCAQWLPDKVTVEYAANYSGYNYMLGSDLGKNYSNYIYSRSSSTYLVEVDDSERLNSASSLKIVGAAAGSSGKDLAFITSTNRGYGDGFSQTGLVGDEKDLILHFYAKSSVDGASMYFRWGYSSEYTSVTLTKDWKVYSIVLPKNRFFGSALHPYFDKAGTFYLNSLALGDSVFTTNVVPETGTWITSQTVDRGGRLSSIPVPERNGYDFLGWYTAAEGGNLVTSESTINESSLRLYAHWVKKVSETPVETVEYNGHMYELYDNVLGWEDAEDFCESMGGHLITVSTPAENDLAYDMIKGRQGYCWLGLRYYPSSEEWVWTDGASLSSYRKWYNIHYETEDTGEYFALLYPMNFGTTSYAGTWDKCYGSSNHASYYGYYNSFFICEYDDPEYCGDANGDGEIEAVDATLIQRHSVGLMTSVSEEMLLRGDVDGDGEADIIDTTYILRYLAKLNIPYAVGEWVKKK